MRRDWLLVLVIVLALGALPPLAHASPPDSLWIAGIYDAGDLDDAVVTAASTEGSPVVGAPILGAPQLARAAVQPPHPNPLRSSARPAFEGRAPPPAG